MATLNFESVANAERLDLYRRLSLAQPVERANILFRFMEKFPGIPLELPVCNGQRAMLDEIDLSPQSLRGRIKDGVTPPAWWNVDRQSIDLRNADFRGASLRHVDFRGALLEKGNFSETDLAGANLADADLSGANLQGALLEDADLHAAVLRFAQGPNSIWEGANAIGADFWGAQMEAADLSGVDFQGATLEEASFRRANLAGADLRGAVLKRTNFRNATLQGADLRGAALGGTNFEDAILQNANLQELELTHCAITHIHACAARFERTRLYQEQIGGVIGEELESQFGSARKGYLALERNFEELGDHDAARWAYGRRRRMEKRQAGQEACRARAKRQWRAAARYSMKFASDQLVEWVCDYGESIPRVLGTLVVIYLLFIPIYGLTGTVGRVERTPIGTVKTPTYALGDLALFSLTSMTSAGSPPDYLAPRNELAHLLAGLQTLLCLFLTGLMGFVAGNRIRR